MKEKLAIIFILLAGFLLLVYFYSLSWPKIKKEQEQMFSAAKSYIKNYSVPGLEFDLKVLKKLDKWVLLEAIPKNQATDNAGVILEKVNGQWVARAFGTIFPEWEQKVPELFK